MTDDLLASAPPGGGTPSLRFIGNATMLLHLAGLTILTDPNFVPAGTDVPLGYGLTTTRLTDPAIPWEALPPVDVVLLSHYHGDHFDPMVEERLDRTMPILTTPQAADTLAGLGFAAATPLPTWSTRELTGPDGVVRVTALPGRHAPGPLEIALPDVMGSLVEVWPAGSADGGGPGRSAAPSTEPGLRLYITGDTIVFDGLDAIAQRAGRIHLALLHLGGTRVMGVTVTMDAEQGVELMRRIDPDRAAAIHYDDYEAFKSPVEDFVSAAEAAGFGNRTRVLRRGDRLDL